MTINNKSERNYRGKCLGSPVTSYGGAYSESTVQLTKTKVITHNILTYVTASSGRNFHVVQRKSLEIQTCPISQNNKNPVELKHRETSSCYRVFHLMKLRPQKER